MPIIVFCFHISCYNTHYAMVFYSPLVPIFMGFSKYRYCQNLKICYTDNI